MNSPGCSEAEPGDHKITGIRPRQGANLGPPQNLFLFVGRVRLSLPLRKLPFPRCIVWSLDDAIADAGSSLRRNCMQEQYKDRKEWVRAALEQFEQPLIRYATRLTGSAEAARDVVQETFLKLCTADRGKVDSHLAAWLYTVCRNQALDTCRKERRMTPLSDTVARTRPGTQPPPSAIAESEERRSRVMEALDGLTPNQQEVIRLKFQDALSYREISEITGLSVSNVGFLIHVGIRQLRKQLAAQPQANEA